MKIIRVGQFEYNNRRAKLAFREHGGLIIAGVSFGLLLGVIIFSTIIEFAL